MTIYKEFPRNPAVEKVFMFRVFSNMRKRGAIAADPAQNSSLGNPGALERSLDCQRFLNA